MSSLAQATKAIYAFVAAGLGSLATALVDDKSIGDLTDGQWVVVILAAVVAGGGVYGLSNKPPA
jgi:hypothetical protein